jgi:transglutaminase-like putative cysteine protease
MVWSGYPSSSGSEAPSTWSRALEVRGEPVHYTVTQEVSNRPWLTLLEMSPEPPKLPGFELTRTADMQWLSDRPFSEIVRFKATSYPGHRYGPAQPTPALQSFVDMPQASTPVRCSGQRICVATRAMPTPATGVWIDVALERLRTGGYTYTLDPGEFGIQTADEFWFDKKEGFCEHIASSFVILMRGLEHSGAHCHGLPRGRVEHPGQLLGGTSKRRPRLG